MNRGTCWATVHMVAQNPDMTEATMHACKHTYIIFFRYVKNEKVQSKAQRSSLIGRKRPHKT